VKLLFLAQASYSLILAVLYSKTCYLHFSHSDLTMATAVSFETLVIVYQITIVTCHKTKILTLTTLRK
jgi:hypothetical protein